MHPYATDSSETKAVPLYIAALGVVAAYLLHVTLEKTKFTIPWWIDAPSVVGFYGLFYAVFNTWLWRSSWVRKIRLVKIPDLHGIWKGDLITSFDEHSGKHNAELQISQTWTRISINLKTDSSQSHSLIGGIITQNYSATVLDYECSNEPRSHAKATMHAHRGTARLVLNKNNDLWILEGDYYSGRDRQNYGTIRVEKATN